MAPGLSPDSRTMSCIVVRWNPLRSKQVSAASRTRRRCAALRASVIRGIGSVTEASHGDAIQRRRALGAAQGEKKTCPQLGGRIVAEELETPSGEELRHALREEPEGPGLAQAGDVAEPAVPTWKVDRPVEEAGVDISKNEGASGRRASDGVEGGIHGFGREVVGDPFPEKERRTIAAEAHARERPDEIVLLEVHRNVDDGMKRQVAPVALHALRRLRGRVVDLEHSRRSERREAMSAAVEPC